MLCPKSRASDVLAVVGALLILAGMVAFLIQPVRAASTTVVIGEVQTQGDNGLSDEFVEIYNLSGSPVNLNNYRLRYQSCTGTAVATRYTFPDVNLQAYGHYLIARASYYNGTTTPDGTYLSSIADCGKLRLYDNGNVVDTLGYTDSSAPSGGWVGDGDWEGYFGSNPATNTADRSMARKPDTLSQAGGHKNGQDTDDNSNDFLATTASSPENISNPNAVVIRSMSARLVFAGPLMALGALAVVGGVIWRTRSRG